MNAESHKQSKQWIGNTKTEIAVKKTNSGISLNGNEKPDFSNSRRIKSRGIHQLHCSSQQKNRDASNVRKTNPDNHHPWDVGTRQDKSKDMFNRMPQKVLISLAKLHEFIQRNPNEILLIILDKHSGFLSRLEEINIRHDLMACLFIALGKACSADMHKNIIDLIKVVNGSRNSILIHIQRYLVWLQKQEKLEKNYIDSLFYITVLLQKFQLILPSSSSDLISMLLPLLYSTKERCLKAGDDSYVTVTEKIKEVDEENKYFLEHHSLLEIKRDTEKEKLHLLEPNESFRSIPVLPTKDDIDLPCTFLRPNIVKGKYKDTEHYLDVQFRLLREDYIKPLRDGISEYLNLKKHGKSFKNCKNVRVYSNATIAGEEFLNGHLLHFVYFSDKFFSAIKWDRSKRLLTGSLLCLSSDDFQTMLFATVVRRDPEELKEGVLCIQFQEITENVLKLNSSIKFVIIETTAYFEAYRHNLSALQLLNDEMLPLKKYIVDVEKTVGKPRYLLPSTTYDMRPLMIPLNKEHIHCEKETKYKYPPTIGKASESVSVLNESAWPTASDLNLDNSQYLALKEAITKELAIIQGPPGTGKTYIGLRIVQLLLHNLKTWFSNESKSVPILIVCFTNHALDQFLEGLLLFTKNIVRIGGRGTNEAISKFQIRGLKRSYIKNNKFPEYLTNNMWSKKAELKQLKEKIDYLNTRIENSVKIVLSESELEICIPFFQYESLKYGYFGKEYGGYYETTIYDWLSVSSQITVPMQTLPKNQNKFHSKNSVDLPLGEVNEVESEDEADVEYIENERDIDFYDFEEIPFCNRVKYTEVNDFEDSLFCNNVKYNEIVDCEDSEWQTPVTKTQRNEMMKEIKRCLELSETMEEDVAMKVDNVWMLDIEKRWKLYKFWVQKYAKKLKEKLLDLQEELKNKFDEMAEMQIEEDLCILYDADIVGITTTGAAKYRHLIQRLNPTILIVEEAAEILESHVVTSLAPKTEHVILIGDQQQLRPSPCVYTLALKYDMDVSLFERMIKNGMSYCKLSIQHRMRPDIAALIAPHIYSNLINHKIVTEFEDIKGVKKNVFFISHKNHESQEKDSKSKVNEHEAKFLLKLCRYLILQGYDPSQITILTTYSGQLFTLKNLASDVVKKVRMTVVDNFQGEENDIILLSFVRSNKEGEIGFLKVSNRVCVALSRAKKGLFCIGNFELLAEKSNLWKNIIATLVQNQSIGSSLELFCQNHPNISIGVATETDFTAVSDGGCARNCDYRLDCGHVCPLRCHPYNHELIRCEKPCVKTCAEGHQCIKKCFQFCGFCRVLINRTLALCGHTLSAPCGKDENEIECTFDCDKILSCSHKCVNKCSESCVEECVEPCSKTCERNHPCKKKCFEECGSCDVPVEKTLERCGHTVEAYCGKDDIACSFDCKRVLHCSHNCTNKCGEPCIEKCEQLKEILSPVCNHTLNVPCFTVNNTGELLSRYLEDEVVKCSELCQEVLPCGHVCKGTCGSCNQGRLHIACNEPCGRILICGHKCTSSCFKSCPPCQKPCENRCIHGKCLEKCSQPCIKCTKPCEWSCCHKKCTRLCGEICNRDPCNEPCPKFLPCNHPCIGFCGEPCPHGCGICDNRKDFDSVSQDEVSKSKNEASARYILLEDCNHKFELQSIDDKMTIKIAEDEIQLKTCPTCKTVIRKNLRYGNVIKTCLIQIEKVKEITRWNKEKNSRLQRILSHRLLELRSYRRSSYQPLMEALSSKKTRNINELTTVENIINIISVYESCETFSRRFKCLQNISISIASKLLADYTRISDRLVSFIQKYFLLASEYQLMQLSLEVCRLRLISKLLNYAVTHDLPSCCPEFETCAQYLLNSTPLDGNVIKTFTTAFQTLTVKFGNNDDLSSLKKVSLLKGMNMSTGHWYQCAKGHVYCLIVCTEVTQKDCYECMGIKVGSYSNYFTNRETYQPFQAFQAVPSSTRYSPRFKISRMSHLPSRPVVPQYSKERRAFPQQNSQYSKERRAFPQQNSQYSKERRAFPQQNFQRRAPRSLSTSAMLRNAFIHLKNKGDIDFT